MKEMINVEACRSQKSAFRLCIASVLALYSTDVNETLQAFQGPVHCELSQLRCESVDEYALWK